VSILDRIRKLFGSEEIPEDAARIYRMSKDEAEALRRLEAERGRCDRHRSVLTDDIRALSAEEERLLEAGRAEGSGVRRRLFAKEVAEVRGRIAEFMNRVDLLTRRIALFDRQAGLLRDRAVLEGPLPEREEIERAAEDVLVARTEFEDLEELSDVHRDVSRLPGETAGEERALREFEGEREEELSFDELVAQEEKRARRREEREALEE
jgi:hypothetical protein